MAFAFFLNKDSKKYKPIPLFQSEAPLELTLKGDFFKNERNFKRLKFIKEKEYSTGFLTYSHSGKDFKHPTKIKPRGGTRHRGCQIPPYKLKISKRDGTLFDHAKKTMKLVTHCHHYPDGTIKNTIENQKVISEYLAYKLISEIYPMSFSTRLITINYVDLKYGQISKGFGILLENKKNLAKRYQVKAYKGKKADIEKKYFKPADQFPFDNFVYLTLANSMINNIDWRPLLNNILIKNKNKEYILVPYDLDKTGLVLDYGEFVKAQDPKRKKWYKSHQSFFHQSRFPHYRSFRNLEKNPHGDYKLDLKKIKDIYLKYANIIYSKKDQVFSVLKKNRHFLVEKNFKLMNKRVDQFFNEIYKGVQNKSFKFFTSLDYIEHLKNGDLEAKDHAIRALAHISVNKDEDFNHVYSLYIKEENRPLKKMINQLVVRESGFGTENATKLIKASKFIKEASLGQN